MLFSCSSANHMNSFDILGLCKKTDSFLIAFECHFVLTLTVSDEFRTTLSHSIPHGCSQQVKPEKRR